MERYRSEREARLAFCQRFLPRTDAAQTAGEPAADSIVNGNLLELRLHVTDIGAALFQCIRRLSARRIAGLPVPAGIHVVDLSAGVDRYYESAAYLDRIERAYSGGAATDGGGVSAGAPAMTLRYADRAEDAAKLDALLRERRWTKIHIDENCIVGWASAFYRAKPDARKEDFLGDDSGARQTMGEIRRPDVFQAYIHPYTGETNVRFSYLMDKLNDTRQQKNLGAFYTPPAYAEKSLELLRQAIARVPEGNDYIILDRCAGTGNLEAGLTDAELSHCIVSTIEYYEYRVLQELIGSKVRCIISSSGDVFHAGLVRGADALSREYIENETLRRYVNDPRCTIILFENPPYAEPQARTINTKAEWKNSYVLTEMRKAVSGPASNDLGNAFIWSGFRFFLRQPTDSYVVYSPVKYWKAQKLIDRRFIAGFGFNRRWFHTNIDAFIMCALWANEKSDAEEITVRGYDYDAKSDKLIDCGRLPVKQVRTPFSAAYYEKRKFADDALDGVACAFDGTEVLPGAKALSIKPLYNTNILGYMRVGGFNFDNPDLESSLLVAGCYNGHGFYLRADNYMEKLPMFAASRYITYNREWTERTRIMKSADGAARFAADVASGKLDAFLRKCLLFTCMETQNHMRSFTGSDGRLYRNELCLDCTNGETAAARDLRALTPNAAERRILAQWAVLMSCAKRSARYDPALTYGVYQIFAELDRFHTDESSKANVPEDPALHSAYTALKSMVKAYYNDEIVPVLFAYEFLK